MHNEDELTFGGVPINTPSMSRDRAKKFTFTDDQTKAYNGLIKFINEPYNPKDFKRALIGPGGTGKTFLLKALLQDCNIPFSEIGLSAPSHKACRVLRNSIKGTHCNVNTIQSDFGFKPNYDIEKFDINNVTFASYGRIKIEDYRLYIVDESSMLNRSLVTYIDKMMKKYSIKLILCGDDAQIPPVNERDSYAFKGVKAFRLTQIVRQDEDNPIRTLTELLRGDVYNGTFNFLNYISRNHSKFDNTMTKGFVVCNSAQFQREVVKQFSDEAITRNTDYVKVIAYTNIAVSAWNKFIREHNLNAGNLWRTLNPVKRTYEINGRFYTYYQKNHHCKGYTLLGKFNDYPDREYIQMDGSGELLRNEDEDIVCSYAKV